MGTAGGYRPSSLPLVSSDGYRQRADAAVPLGKKPRDGCRVIWLCEEIGLVAVHVAILAATGCMTLGRSVMSQPADQDVP